jgi:hypothetical protein
MLVIHSGLSQEVYCDAKGNSMGHMFLSFGEEIKEQFKMEEVKNQFIMTNVKDGL